MQIRRVLPLPLALAVLIAIPASAADQSVTATPGASWSPGDVTIDMGDTVTWNNGGGFHNVDFNDGSFTEPPTPDSSSWTVDRTFDTAGIFRYQCGFHGASMSGVVRVRDETGVVPEPDLPPGLSVAAPAERTLAQFLDRGLRVRSRCDNGCNITLKLTLSPKTAKRLGFAKRRKTVGTASDSLGEGQRVPIDVAVKQRVKNKLEDAERTFKVRLDVRATKDTRETARRTIKITP